MRSQLLLSYLLVTFHLLLASRRVHRPAFKSKLVAEGTKVGSSSPATLISSARPEEMRIPATHVTTFASAYHSGDPELLEFESGRLMADTTFHLMLPSCLALIAALYQSEELRALPLAEALRRTPFRSNIYGLYGIMLTILRLIHLRFFDAPSCGRNRTWTQIFALIVWKTHIVPGILFLAMFPNIICSPLSSVPFIMAISLYVASIEFAVSQWVPRHSSS